MFVTLMASLFYSFLEFSCLLWCQSPSDPKLNLL